MANNLVQSSPKISVAASHPAEPVTGDPVRLGSLVGVALTDEGEGGNAAANTSVDFTPGKIWRLNVDDNEGSGIAPGDKLYYHDTQTGSPATSINNTPTSADAEAGIALGTLGTNATGEIDVMIGAATG